MVDGASFAETAWDDLGGWLFSDHNFAIQHSVRGPMHRFELQRVVERNDTKVTRWATLDAVEVRLTTDEIMCIGPARTEDGSDGEFLAIAIEDRSHVHPVRRAWRANLRLGRLEPTSVAGVICDVDECNDDEEQ